MQDPRMKTLLRRMASTRFTYQPQRRSLVGEFATMPLYDEGQHQYRYFVETLEGEIDSYEIRERILEREYNGIISGEKYVKLSNDEARALESDVQVALWRDHSEKLLEDQNRAFVNREKNGRNL